ncbi:MAG: hypothetical protein RBS80_01860 [Thermoguttaceae bacterium]|jgi:DNA-binding transcriptional ArsR family regulator|nr:hypothetical protein [Thermoguttaceae bacterium]
MTPTLTITEELQSLQSNPFVEDLLSALDAQTRDAVLCLLASLSEDVLEEVLEAIEQLDRCNASVDTLAALLKGKQVGVALEARQRKALGTLLEAAEEFVNRSCHGR